MRGGPSSKSRLPTLVGPMVFALKPEDDNRAAADEQADQEQAKAASNDRTHDGRDTHHEGTLYEGHVASMHGRGANQPGAEGGHNHRRTLSARPEAVTEGARIARSYGSRSGQGAMPNPRSALAGRGYQGPPTR